MSAAKLLDCLDKVKQTAPDKWQARCPAHDDQSPSLSIKETDGGTVLVKCWAGCGAADVMAAVGLELKDLFPEKLPDSIAPKGKRRSPWVPRDALQALAVDALFISICAEDQARGQTLDDAERERLTAASRRFMNAYTEVSR